MKATSAWSSRCPLRGLKRKNKKTRIGTTSDDEKTHVEVRSDENSIFFDVYASCNGDFPTGHSVGCTSLVCCRVRCRSAGDLNRQRDQDGLDQSSFVDLH